MSSWAACSMNLFDKHTLLAAHLALLRGLAGGLLLRHDDC